MIVHKMGWPGRRGAEGLIRPMKTTVRRATAGHRRFLRVGLGIRRSGKGENGRITEKVGRHELVSADNWEFIKAVCLLPRMTEYLPFQAQRASRHRSRGAYWEIRFMSQGNLFCFMEQDKDGWRRDSRRELAGLKSAGGQGGDRSKLAT